MLGSDIRLFVAEQVKNEVKRNRENKINELQTAFFFAQSKMNLWDFFILSVQKLFRIRLNAAS